MSTSTDEAVDLEQLIDEDKPPECQGDGEWCTKVAKWRAVACHLGFNLCQECKNQAQIEMVLLEGLGKGLKCKVCDAWVTRIRWVRL